MSVGCHCSSGRCSERVEEQLAEVPVHKRGQRALRAASVLCPKEKIEALSKGPAGQPDTSPLAWVSPLNLGGLPCPLTVSLPLHRRPGTRGSYDLEMLCGEKRQPSARPEFCRRGSRCPGDGMSPFAPRESET